MPRLPTDILRRLSDKYYFLTAWIIARNLITRQYRDSFLGVLWTVLQPMTHILVYTFVCAHVMRFPVNNYMLFICSSFLVWQFINSVLLTSTMSIIGHSQVISRCTISVTTFPIAEVLRHSYTFLVNFVVMYSVTVLFVEPFDWHALLVPFFMLPNVLAAFAVAIAVSLATPYMRDLGDLITVGMSVSFWLTPVIYPASIVPEKYQQWLEFNPFHILIRPITALMYEHRLPNLHELTTQYALIALIGLIAFTIYRKCRANFVYYL